ncbi:MAG: DNA repair protein RecN [Clostridiales bacterium]|nr:DNA repair protein RecN [Clostridiales bacterium]
MITNLHIKNIGIIEDLNIDFNKGLNVLTGETGAGKTLIIDSLQIISGGRFSKEMIRRGENNSFVELCMYVPNSPKAEDGNIIVSREINTNGKNMCKINGRMVTVNELKEFMAEFIEIHGQNDTQGLLNSKKHLNYLDGFSGEKLVKLKNRYQELYLEYIRIQKELKANFGDDKERQRKIDLLQYQIKEIEEADLKENEEEELEEQRNIIANSAKISENLQKANSLIEDGGIDNISMAIRALEKIEDIDKKYQETSTNLKNLYYELQEVARDINGYKDDTYFDENERNGIEERLDLIRLLKRKYGNTIKEILEYREKIEQELDKIENAEEYNNKLKTQIKEIETEMTEKAQEMHEIRKLAGSKLSLEINNELQELEMKNAKISVNVKYVEKEFFTTGKDIVKFYIATNVGEEEKELSKIASGGEMSRIMLAIKKVLAEYDNISILVFDEIDTGISGKAANSVGNKLKSIAGNHQVLCISHLPNIVAQADYNYFISKNVIEDRTKTQIKLLKENEVIEEIARISSGEINEVTMQYATELRNRKAS